MIVKKKIRRKMDFFNRFNLRWLFLLCAGLFLTAYLVPDLKRDSVKFKVHIAPNAAHAPELAEENAPPKKERPSYPYSVIPGGVRNRGELAVKVVDDRVIADHYADFNIGEAKIVPIKETRFAYVSYRLRNKIYWTAKKVKIPKGESIITDGRCDARARCGNRISASPLEPVSGEEPVLESLDIPEMTMASPIFEPIPFDDRISLALAPPLMISPVTSPSLDMVPSAGKSGWTWPYNYRGFTVLTPDIVPESSSLSLLLLGLTVLILYKFISSR